MDTIKDLITAHADVIKVIGLVMSLLGGMAGATTTFIQMRHSMKAKEELAKAIEQLLANDAEFRRIVDMHNRDVERRTFTLHDETYERMVKVAQSLPRDERSGALQSLRQPTIGGRMRYVDAVLSSARSKSVAAH